LIEETKLKGSGAPFYSHAHQHAAPKATASGRARRADQPDFAFFRHDETGPHMSDADLALCKSLERKLIIRG
jgi:hypothetical protein